MRFKQSSPERASEEGSTWSASANHAEYLPCPLRDHLETNRSCREGGPCAYVAQPYSTILVPPGFGRNFPYLTSVSFDMYKSSSQGIHLVLEGRRADGAGRCSGSDFDTDQSRNVYLVPLIAFASLIWHGAVSKACEKVPALAQLKKWSLADPL